MSAVAKKWKKLTPADVAEIRLRVQAGETKTALGREYGVAMQTVAYHVQGKALAGAYAKALSAAAEARRRGDRALAARHLENAARALLEEKP